MFSGRFPHRRPLFSGSKIRAIKIPFPPEQAAIIHLKGNMFKDGKLNMIFPFDLMKLYWEDGFEASSDGPYIEGYFYTFG